MSIANSSNFKIENSVLTNVHGNATIFRFDSGGSLTEEFKSVILQHMTGSVTVQNLDKVEEDILSQSIRNIPHANAAYNDYASKNRKRVACFEGTRRALLLEIGEWAVDPNGALFYVLFGIAGVGKSTIAQTFAEKADILRLLGASFFFSRDEADRKDAAKFFTSIAFQLCIFDGRFAQAIGQVLSQEKGIAAMSKEPHEQLNILILGPLRRVVKPGWLPILIVVDALDECDEQDREVIIAELNRLVTELPSFKVFLTTRPHPYLEDIVSIGNPHRVFRLEDIEKKVVDSDIRVYLKHSLSHKEVNQCLRRLAKPWSASDSDIESLVRAAGQLFIVASTSVRFILDIKARTPASRMQALLDTSGQGRTPLKALNDFYTVILRCAVPKDCDKDILENYQAVVGAIIVIRTPLLIESFSELIGVSEERISAVLDNLQSVIYLGKNDNMPRIYHKSFPDFITDPGRCKDDSMRITPKYHHIQMAVCCLRVMNKRLKRNILGLGVLAQYLDNDVALKEEQISERQLSKTISMDLEYACVHWVMHVKEADIKNTELVVELKSFADNHLLHWFEALSWVGKLSIAPSALSILMGLLKSSPDDTDATFYDAFRCVSMSFDDINRSALHTYHSALPFVPTKRPLVEKFKRDMTHGIVGGREEWDAEITTLDSRGEVIRILFSPDGSQLAFLPEIPFSLPRSFYRPSSRYNLAVRDAASGIPLATFSSIPNTLADDFSVVASARKSTVTLHSIATNTHLATVQYSKRVRALALSFNGSLLAAALDDGKISLWDVNMKVAIPAALSWVKQGKGGLILSVSDDKVAYESRRGIELWYVANGEPVCCLDHPNVKQITFFRDGSRLVSMDEKALHVWDAKSGESMCFISCDEGRFAISTDGSLVAAYDCYKVELWSGDTLSLVNTFEFRKQIQCLAISAEVLAIGVGESVELYDVKRHSILAVFKSSSTKLLAISPDSTRLAGAGRSGNRNSVHLWEVPRIEASVSEPNKRVGVTALAFSRDCSRLASGFEDGTVQLWDTTHSAHIIRTHKLDSSPIDRSIFSPDAEHFITQCISTTCLRIWDGKDGSPVTLFDFNRFGSASCPPVISRHLLAIAAKHEIHVWDHTTSCTVHILLDDEVHSLSFSPDGSLLASAQLNSATLWDVVKGTKISTFRLFDRPSYPPETLAFSPDASKLAVEAKWKIVLVDLVNKNIDENPRQEDLSWLPEPLILNPVTHISRRFLGHDTPVPVLRLPGRVGASVAAQGSSSLIALGCRDGQVLIVRLSTLTS